MAECTTTWLPLQLTYKAVHHGKPVFAGKIKEPSWAIMAMTQLQHNNIFRARKGRQTRPLADQTDRLAFCDQSSLYNGGNGQQIGELQQVWCYNYKLQQISLSQLQTRRQKQLAHWLRESVPLEHILHYRITRHPVTVTTGHNKRNKNKILGNLCMYFYLWGGRWWVGLYK